MDSIFSWLAAGLGGLLFVAMVVAWWEYLGHKAARHDLLTEAPQPRRAVTVDVDLDAVPGDAAERRQVLGGAMARMTQPGSLGRAEDRRKRWPDTAPMIGASLRPEDPAAAVSAARTLAPSEPG